jgi:hypothetical protein
MSNYDFIGNLQKLLIKVDVNDEAMIARRAVELHAFQYSLYFTGFTQIPSIKKRPLPNADMVALVRKYAALQLFNYYASRAAHRAFRTPSLYRMQTDLADNFRPIEALLALLRDYLIVERDGPSVLETIIPRDGFKKEFRRQTEKSEVVARLIEAYMTNGDELPNTHGRPIGSKIMREALRRAAPAKLSSSKAKSGGAPRKDHAAWRSLVKLSQRTLYKYSKELGHTAVFHYLMRIHGCEPALDPLDHYDKDFPHEIMRRARSADELRGVCLMYNAAVTKLNEKYRFDFVLIENVPDSETETGYGTLGRDKPDPVLTEAIRAVTGLTA